MTGTAGFDLALRALPPATALAFIGYLVIWRAWRFHARYGRSPIHIPSREDLSLHAMLSRALVLYFAALILLSVTAGLYPEWVERGDPLFSHRSLTLTMLGLVLVAASSLLIRRAQEDMAGSWRIGIDTGERTSLVTSGTFQFCRNPIYLGLMMALVGYCLMIPGMCMGLLTLTAVLLFNVQARLEEKYLLEIHGEVYARYRTEVGRFLPWKGCHAGAQPGAGQP